MINLPDHVQQRHLLYSLLGDLPARGAPISVRRLEQSEQDGYLLEKLILDLNGIEPVPAYFVKPIHSSGRIPCLLYNHAHGGDYQLGKDELLLGRKELSTPPYAQALTSHGWAALCIDAWCFGERHGRTETETFKEMLWKGQVLWGQMVYDSLRALDYLVIAPGCGCNPAWHARPIDGQHNGLVDCRTGPAPESVCGYLLHDRL